MSYLATYRRGVQRPSSLGASVLDTAKGAAQAAGSILTDPALPEVTRIVMQLKATEKASAGPKDAQGIGLRHALPPLRGFLYYRQHPWIVPVGIAAVLAAPFYMGFLFGKKRKRA